MLSYFHEYSNDPTICCSPKSPLTIGISQLHIIAAKKILELELKQKISLLKGSEIFSQ